MNRSQKFYIGPMSKEIVDVILEDDENIFAFIPSRRQIDFSSGYVNNWTTKTFSDYVKARKPNFLICRDHAGGNQGSYNDSGFESLYNDSLYFDMIHVDPWKYTQNIDQGADLTCEYINFCLNFNSNILFEIATEESIFPFDNNLLQIFIDLVYKKLGSDKFDKISHIVIQSGTKLRGNNQIGDYCKYKLVEQIEVVKKFDKLTKEHNGDYIDPFVIKEKFDLGLDAINIAPEFGYIQTSTILENMPEEKLDLFFKYCLDSNKWRNWVSSDFNPYENKLSLIKICGHYIFSNPNFINDIHNQNYIPIIQQQLKNKLVQLRDIT